MNHFYLANALVTNDKGEMLAVRKQNSEYFQMVGGKIETNEEPIVTLQREFLEEINIDINQHIVNFLGKYSTMAVNEKNTEVHADVFHVHLKTSDTLKMANEIAEIAWITKENYTKYKLAHLLEEFSLPIWLTMNF
ncbi:NUDIX domain-containing protein [Chishuiella sp.]|uniref:NUDIX hydrolase n=1 Tax=Chishuiella sp. TaxID=1969467 RepID=UPI0028B0E59A|nr:NUDIX domain-containing protein [Chishuiella sp.]